MKAAKKYRRGDIYITKTNPHIGFRSSIKAVLLLQNDTDEFYSTSVFAVPIAMKPSPFPAPSEKINVYLSSMSMVQYNKAGAVDKRTLTDYVGTLDSDQLEIVYFVLQEHWAFSSPKQLRLPDEASQFKRVIPRHL